MNVIAVILAVLLVVSFALMAAGNRYGRTAFDVLVMVILLLLLFGPARL